MSTERPVFVAHSLCPPHLRKQVEDVAESFNPNWLLLPKDGEVFESFQECFARLQGYGRSLTAAEKEADKAEIEARKQAQEGITEVVPNSPGCPSTPLGRKRTRTLVERTPGKPPTPARAAPALPQSPEASSPPHLPPSTAPARLYTGKGGSVEGIKVCLKAGCTIGKAWQ
jgi:hypothetical protein